MAIAAVTEAVDHCSGHDMKPSWTLLSINTLYAARWPIPWVREQSPRVIRPNLMFPMFWGPQNLLVYPDVVTEYRDEQNIRDSCQTHIFLVKVLFNRGPLRLPQLVVLDSSHNFIDKSSQEWQLVVSEMRRMVTNLGIWDYPTTRVNDLPPLENFEIVFEQEIHETPAQQQNSWACGVHTIMNAWAEALAFRIDPAHKMERISYRHAVSVINLVLEGRATLRLIATLLVHTGFVFYDHNDQDQAMTQWRETPNLLREYHQISSSADLDLVIATHNYEKTQKLKDIAQKNQLDTALALSVSRTVLPKIRMQALKIKQLAAKKSATKVGPKTAKTDVKAPLSPSTLDHFLSLPKVSKSDFAKRFCGQVWEDLKKDKSIKKRNSARIAFDDGSQDIDANDERYDKDDEPGHIRVTKNSKDTFIKRCLGHRIGGLEVLWRTGELDYGKKAYYSLRRDLFDHLIDLHASEDPPEPIQPNPPIYPELRRPDVNEREYVQDFQNFLMQALDLDGADPWELFLQYLPKGIEYNMPTIEQDPDPDALTRFDRWSWWFYRCWLWDFEDSGDRLHMDTLGTVRRKFVRSIERILEQLRSG